MLKQTITTDISSSSQAPHQTRQIVDTYTYTDETCFGDALEFCDDFQQHAPCHVIPLRIKIALEELRIAWQQLSRVKRSELRAVILNAANEREE